MALVKRGTIEINGIVADCTSWDISGGPSKEGKFGTGKQFLGYTESPAVYEIKLSIQQATGKPRIKWSELLDGFTLVRNYENGARHQFLNCTVSNDGTESADETNFTGEVTLLAAERVEQ
jgi:hypothetical protein